MEGVEEANRAAVGSCKKLVARLSQPGDPFRLAAVAAETDEAVSRFDKVVTILSNRVGHARARLGKRSSPPVDPSCFMDHPMVSCPPRNGFLHGSTAPALPPPPPQARSAAQAVVPVPVVAAVAPCAAGKVIAPAAKVDRNMFLETPLLDLNGCSVPSSVVSVKNSPKVVTAPAANHPCCTTQIQFRHHQQQQMQQKKEKRFQFDQKPSEKFHIEMAPRISGGGGGAKEPEVITFSFDNSVCTSSAATTSFFTSISSQMISMSDAGTNSAAAAAPSSKKVHCARKAEEAADGKCHCPKKKKPRERRVVRMPAISDRVADIPEDNYSWRKYGQKPIKGSPHPRGYYRCSSMKDCPARKHVEKCRSDPGMLIVTYENEHNHEQPMDLSMLVANSEA